MGIEGGPSAADRGLTPKEARVLSDAERRAQIFAGIEQDMSTIEDLIRDAKSIYKVDPLADPEPAEALRPLFEAQDISSRIGKALDEMIIQAGKEHHLYLDEPNAFSEDQLMDEMEGIASEMDDQFQTTRDEYKKLKDRLDIYTEKMKERNFFSYSQ